MSEKWSAINGYFGLYEVSNYGRVKSLSRVAIGKANSKRIIKERILRVRTQTGGYKTALLSKGNRHKSKYIHRLVGEHFIENPHNKPEINHKDLDKSNNVYSNLEWATRKENQHHYNSRKPLICK